jgi:periplasmic divalent cation tolerance protein
MQFVFTTFSSEEEATHVIRTLVEERLIACGNISARSTSIYRWKGAVTTENEWTAILKTTDDLLEELTKRLTALHSYDVPEIVSVPVTSAAASYLAWIEESCKKDPAALPSPDDVS